MKDRVLAVFPLIHEGDPISLSSETNMTAEIVSVRVSVNERGALKLHKLSNRVQLLPEIMVAIISRTHHSGQDIVGSRIACLSNFYHLDVVFNISPISQMIRPLSAKTDNINIGRHNWRRQLTFTHRIYLFLKWKLKRSVWEPCPEPRDQKYELSPSNLDYLYIRWSRTQGSHSSCRTCQCFKSTLCQWLSYALLLFIHRHLMALAAIPLVDMLCYWSQIRRRMCEINMCNWLCGSISVRVYNVNKQPPLS